MATFKPLHERFAPLAAAITLTKANQTAQPTVSPSAPSYSPGANLTLAERKRRGDTGSRSGSLR